MGGKKTNWEAVPRLSIETATLNASPHPHTRHDNLPIRPNTRTDVANMKMEGRLISPHGFSTSKHDVEDGVLLLTATTTHHYIGSGLTVDAH